MGLDMYLYADKYVSAWDHAGDKEKKAYKAIAKAAGLGGIRCDGSPHLNVRICVGYWRKCNAIHAWFVRNCAKGVDDCKPMYVDREKLTELRELCKTAFCHVEVGAIAEAQATLPPQSGFFFGDTEVNEYYQDEMKYTANLIDEVLDTKDGLDGVSFYYQASW